MAVDHAWASYSPITLTTPDKLLVTFWWSVIVVFAKHFHKPTKKRACVRDDDWTSFPSSIQCSNQGDDRQGLDVVQSKTQVRWISTKSRGFGPRSPGVEWSG
jgi:hypothetical protein